jgi:hypothetical protein
VRSSRPSLRDSARFLWAISSEVFESGVRGRLGTIRTVMARSVPVPQPPKELALLVDHNSGKLAHAERVFGIPFALVDPLVVWHLWRWRVLLVFACALPDRLRAVVTSLIHAANLRHHLASGEQVYLWNPYSLLQYAVDELVSSEAVYHLEASYPPLRWTRHAFGCPAALELLGYPTERQVLAVQPWTFNRHDPILSVYLTKLDVVHRSPTELAILEAVRAWRGSTTRPIEIFLHYSDRGVAALDPKYADFFAEFGDLVSDRGSLDSSSRAQISLSALSSIGLDLLSMEIAHFVVTWEVKPGEPHDGWRSRLSPTRPDVLRLGESPDDWLWQMRLNHPELFDRVFREGVCQ